MPEELVVPPVVAVVVTSDPGDWFEACLESLSSQDYPNLALLVVDDASATEVAPRVAAVEPEAIVRRREERGGYSAAADEALVGIEGATFLLFCHDDVELEPGAVRGLVEESFRSNAAVIGPKVLRADDPERLVQVGLGMHRLGTPAPRVEAGELDQSQHDEVREVFAVPGGCTLVRADLFEALGGFDREMTMFGEDVDFSWRAQVAGARVVVAPQAVVRHRQTTASREGAGEADDAAGLQRRHELRAALKNYGALRRLVIVPELIVLAVAEVVVSMLSGERGRARRVVSAWRWNLAHRASLREARRALRELRQVPDRVLVARMARRGRLRRYLRVDSSELAGASSAWAPAQAGAGAGTVIRTDRLNRADRSGGTARVPVDRVRHAVADVEHALDVEAMASFWTRVRGGEVPAGLVVASVVTVVFVLVGLRDVIVGHAPLVGQLVPMPTGAGLLGQFFGGRTAVGQVGPAPAADAIVGALGVVLGNSSALAWKVIELGSLIAGALGVGRLCGAFASSRGRLVAIVAFVLLPFSWNAVATGDVQAAVVLGCSPFVLRRMLQASGVAPFRPLRPVGLAGEVAPFALLLMAMWALAPAGILAVGAMVVAVVVGCGATGRGAAGFRAAGIALLATAIAAIGLLPWSATFLSSGARWAALAGVVPALARTPASLLRGHFGPVGAWWGSCGIVLAAAYPLLVARRERHRTAVVLWCCAVAAVAVAWVGASGWLGHGGGAEAVAVAPACIAIAALCGLGVTAFERDARSGDLGWRQALAAVAGALFVLGAVPTAGAALGGHSSLPSTGFDQTLDWTSPHRGTPYRVLWLGDPGALPGHGWQLEPGVGWYTTTTGLPSSTQVWPPSSPGDSAPVGRAILAAQHGMTADVGALLAPAGVRYIVVPAADAPSLPGTQVPSDESPAPSALLSALESQGDLIERPTEAGATVFVNAAWSSRDIAAARAAGDGGTDGGKAWRLAGLAGGLFVLALCIAEGVRRRRGWDRAEAVTDVVIESDDEELVLETVS